MVEKNAVSGPLNSVNHCENDNFRVNLTKLQTNSQDFVISDLRNGRDSKSTPYSEVCRLNFEHYNFMYNSWSDVYYSSFVNRNLLKYAQTCFAKYLDLSANRFIVLENKEGCRVVVRLNNRFSSGYQRKVKKRVSWLCHEYKNSNCVMVTLTVNPGKYDNKYLMWTDIKKQQDRFLKSLRDDFKKRGLDLPEYLATIESQKNGNPHLHIVFFNCARLCDWRIIRRKWKKGFIGINRTPDKKKVRNPIDYVAKYITKTFTKSNNDNCLTQSLCWFFGTRSYTCSRGLGLYPLSCSFSSGVWSPVFYVSVSSDVSLSDFNNMILSLGAG